MKEKSKSKSKIEKSTDIKTHRKAKIHPIVIYPFSQSENYEDLTAL